MASNHISKASKQQQRIQDVGCFCFFPQRNVLDKTGKAIKTKKTHVNLGFQISTKLHSELSLIHFVINLWKILPSLKQTGAPENKVSQKERIVSLPPFFTGKLWVLGGDIRSLIFHQPAISPESDSEIQLDVSNGRLDPLVWMEPNNIQSLFFSGMLQCDHLIWKSNLPFGKLPP